MNNSNIHQELIEQYRAMPLTGEGACKLERLCNMLSPAMTLAEVIEDNTAIPEDLREDLFKQFVISMKHVKAILESMTDK